MHFLCTICSDIISQADNIYVTKCGHLFHYQCLSQWIERSATCPQCRRKVSERCMFRLFPTVSDASAEDPAALQSRVDDLMLQLREHKATHAQLKDKLNAATAQLNHSEESLKECEKKLLSRESAVVMLKEQLNYLKVQNKETNRLQQENQMLNKSIQMLNGLQKVLNATASEVDEILEGYSDVKTLATFATALKRALCEAEAKKCDLRNRVQQTNTELAQEKNRNIMLQNKIQQMEEDAIQQRTSRETDSSRLIDESPSNSATNKRTDTTPLQANTNVQNDTSINSMVDRIESSDSPYLSLRRSHMPFALPNAKKHCVGVGVGTSIFSKSTEQALQFFSKENGRDLSFDGMGGRSKEESFPKARAIARPSAKHRLKPLPNHDIARMFNRMDSQNKP